MVVGPLGRLVVRVVDIQLDLVVRSVALAYDLVQAVQSNGRAGVETGRGVAQAAARAATNVASQAAYQAASQAASQVRPRPAAASRTPVTPGIARDVVAAEDPVEPTGAPSDPAAGTSSDGTKGAAKKTPARKTAPRKTPRKTPKTAEKSTTGSGAAPPTADPAATEVAARSAPAKKAAARARKAPTAPSTPGQ